ncbi:FAD-binding and (Fe-S)-binding domain-containing protein [Nocardioides sp. Bht2]|uniref:FAD-binding and (Fe-S)-binding domain-containing protein n=1 Tax=Nocardioides sp. Bht2 TaxID=3392297 RepID=UPI0039B392E6
MSEQVAEADEQGDLRAALRRAGVDDVRDDAASRAAYTSDASLYRVPPRLIAFPRNAEQVAAAIEVAREHRVPLTPRGAGTSVAGNAIGPGIVLDVSKHLDRIIAIDTQARTARVQPGVVQADLQRAAAPFGLRFGPDPSTASRCTIGGMIGNDACGSRSLAYGRTADNVEALSLITGTGAELITSRTTGHRGFAPARLALGELIDTHLSVLRTEFGRFPRQVSGYALQHLLPEHGRDLTRALVGSEGTLGVVTEATVRLIPEPRHRVLVVLGYPEMVTAAEAVPGLLTHEMTACEGLDSRIVDVVRARRAVPELPDGQAWIFAELAGESPTELEARAARLARDSATRHHRTVIDPVEMKALWAIRADGAGLAGRSPAGYPAWPGWEDAAVPPENLAGYLRGFQALLEDHQLTAMPFGHFGEGCVHVRLDFPLEAPDAAQRVTAFAEAAADLVAEHGGSLSGEHGDGRARSALLDRMYSAEAIALFGAVKELFDPLALLNPGVLVAPAALTADLRLPRPAPSGRQVLRLADGDDLSTAVHRCTGVGKCRVTTPASETVMCPSFAATRNEIDSTRGRARVLQEMMDGGLDGGWRDPAVHDALDLCLSCKGCASDCPTGIDMATYKSEVLHHSYRRRLRPRTHYTLGWLPRWADVAARHPRLANALTGSRLTRRLALWAAGVDARRSVPKFAPTTWRQSEPPPARDGLPVVMFVDSFTDHFAPEVAQATRDVLVRAGFAPRSADEQACCALTWITTGQLDAAKKRLARTVELLLPAARAGTPIVGLEPSCTAALRHDAPALLGTKDAQLVADAVVTLAELLTRTPSWTPPILSGMTVLAQPHCHHHAVLGWETDAALLARTGAEVVRLGGCCGLAGNFGVERGHHDVSVAVADLQLMPALAQHPQAIVLADGFSCRTQVDDLAGRHSKHLAQLLNET